MFSQVAKLFLFRKWFAIILETSRQLVGLQSLLVLFFFPFLPLGKSKHHKIASISSSGMVSHGRRLMLSNVQSCAIRCQRQIANLQPINDGWRDRGNGTAACQQARLHVSTAYTPCVANSLAISNRPSA